MSSRTDDVEPDGRCRAGRAVTTTDGHGTERPCRSRRSLVDRVLDALPYHEAMATAFRPAPPISARTWQTFEVPEGYRAEIIRGELVVTPAPGIGHQHVVIRLGHLLDVAAPDDYIATAAVEWELDVSGAVAMAPQPDILVVERSNAKRIERAPLLAVEILSPSDFHRLDRSDLTRIEGKRLDYAANGLADYVEVDLTGNEPVLRRYELVDGVLVVGDTVTGSDTLIVTRPFRYSVRPIDLVP
jgi:Uma2 family endonuclease